MADDQASEFIDEVFDLWFEQKIVREVCKDKMSGNIVSNYDLKAVSLDMGDQYGKMHELLDEGPAVDLMGLDSEWHHDLSEIFMDKDGEVDEVSEL